MQTQTTQSPQTQLPLWHLYKWGISGPCNLQGPQEQCPPTHIFSIAVIYITISQMCMQTHLFSVFSNMGTGVIQAIRTVLFSYIRIHKGMRI
ncbi:hypothetical protein XENTR_v10000443 [Xenopus tropicalis]|nr:hypothetical protein XENTR_v10000443 [Xenopus tropicalis]